MYPRFRGLPGLGKLLALLTDDRQRFDDFLTHMQSEYHAMFCRGMSQKAISHEKIPIFQLQWKFKKIKDLEKSNAYISFYFVSAWELTW